MGAKESYLAISKQAFRRMPQYYHYLKQLQGRGISTVSAPSIARELGLNEVQVRKDLATVSLTAGKPRTGFCVEELIAGIGQCLGYNNLHDAALVGVGHLGRALLSYAGFEEYGVRIVTAFDTDPAVVGQTIHGRQVFSTDRLGDLCGRMNIRIGILCVPAPQAQSVCDLLIRGGILALWNFAPTHLSVPEPIVVQNENMAVSLSLLSQHLAATVQNRQT